MGQFLIRNVGKVPHGFIGGYSVRYRDKWNRDGPSAWSFEKEKRARFRRTPTGNVASDDTLRNLCTGSAAGSNAAR